MRTCRQSGNPGNNFKDVSSGPKYVAEFSDMSLLMQEAISQSELTEAGSTERPFLSWKCTSKHYPFFL